MIEWDDERLKKSPHIVTGHSDSPKTVGRPCVFEVRTLFARLEFALRVVTGASRAEKQRLGNGLPTGAGSPLLGDGCLPAVVFAAEPSS